MNEKDFALGMLAAAEIVRKLGTPYWSADMDVPAKRAFEEITKAALRHAPEAAKG